MQPIRIPKTSRFISTSFATGLCLYLAVAMAPPSSHASPYASTINVTVTNGTTTNVSFYLNEAGGNVTVTYDDGTTNGIFDGVSSGATNLPVGQHSFSLNGHSGYTISVFKIGNGVPFLISNDGNAFNIWNSPRGVAVNPNPQIGKFFGRIYMDQSSPGASKGRGIYALNPDFSEALGKGNTASGTGAFIANPSSPWRIRVAPDNTLLVGDFTTANAGLWQFAPDLSSSNLVLAIIGQNAAAAAGIHGDMFGTAKMTGSQAQGNLVLWTADSGMAVPSVSQAPSLVLGPGTSRGSYNCIFRYNIGTNQIPATGWNHPPDYAYTVGLDGIAELDPEVDVGVDGKIIGGFLRFNLSNPNVQILDPTGATLLWTSWQDTGGASDPWRGEVNGYELPPNFVTDGSYCGVRVSPDGRYLASVGIRDDITIANLTNGIPDDKTLFGIQNSPNTENARGMDWDAADNIYVTSSGQGLTRVFSLGNTETCITSNDITGTNGSFQLIVPPVAASVVATTPTTSQNHGSPTPGTFTISLNTNVLTAPVTVAFTLGGTASSVNYTIGTGTDPNGVIITVTNVTFPVGTYPGVGNWLVNVPITATATPNSGPTLTVVMTVLGGANYRAATPAKDTISIINTGPQVLFLSAAAAPTMSRSVPDDYAEFVITRWGDLTVSSYTVTNITYLGTASFPADYSAQAQNFTGSTLANGSPGFTINPGDITITNAIGNPVAHPINATPNNVTIILSLTNSTTGTNATASNGFGYSVSTNAVTLTELDNAVGQEVVIWSDPLTNSADSTNWTLTFDAESFSTTTVLPVLVRNYTNDETSLYGGGTNDFHVQFGNPVANDSIPPSPTMTANGWNNALRMTVNKNNQSVAAVNLYPQQVQNFGNYALRFNMYLSIYHNAIGNPFAGTFPREFALFGVNHTGTNCNWRPAVPPVSVNGPTNADGVWFAIDAGDNSATPADFDGITSPALPNSGVFADLVSMTGLQNSGIFKNPPFTTQTAAGGEPVDQWVDVSVEVTKQTNCTLYINRSPVLGSFSLVGNEGGVYTNGTVMLGYLDPVFDESDNTAFAYFSNVRVVELSPYIYAQPQSLIVLLGSNVTFSASAWLATAPMTNTWFSVSGGAPALPVQTDTSAATNFTDMISLNNIQVGTNYVPVFSDEAGSVTGQVANVEVITGVPANLTVNAGSNFVQFAVTANGPATPAFQWQHNGTNLANGTHIAGATASTVTITNVELADAGTYTCVMTNNVGSGMAVSATLTVLAASPDITQISVQAPNVVMQFTSPDLFDTTSSFTLQRSVLVPGPYTNTPAVFTGSAGNFQLTVPLTTNTTMFYRLLHN